MAGGRLQFGFTLLPPGTCCPPTRTGLLIPVKYWGGQSDPFRLNGKRDR
jgi:hypothetical protein